MKKFFHVSMTFMVLLILIGCSSLKTNHDYDPTVDFSSLKTFGWIPMKGNPGGSELTVKRVIQSVNDALAAKGLTLRQEEPDFMIGMQVSGKTSYGGSTGLGVSVGVPVGKTHVRVGGGRSKAREKHEGSLLLDFINPQDKSLIWRGTATGAINPNASPQEQQEVIGRAVSQMLSQFPPNE